MTDKRDLAYKSVDELTVIAQSAIDPTTDYIPVYDASAGGIKKMLAKNGYRPSVAAGSALTLTEAAHAGKIILLDTATGSTATLPPATGSGAPYTFVVSTLATSNSHIVKVANANDTIQGGIVSRDDTSDNAVSFFAVAGTDDTITLNRTTTGSVVKGERFTLIDIAANVYQVVDALIANSGIPATPFSATV